MALQRSAGNRAVAGMAAFRAGPGAAGERPLARCAGRCTCGGKCHDEESPIDERTRRAYANALHGAVLSRRARASDSPGGILQRSPCDLPAKLEQGDGVGKTVGFTEYSHVIGEQVGDKAWLLTNFDIDESFVKPGHLTFIRETIVPALKELIQHQGAYVAVIGEASRTAGQAHNLPLSANRSSCVLDVLNRELAAAGVDTAGALFREQHVGQSLAEIRRNPNEPLEQADDRRVAIVPVDRKPDDLCSETDRTRFSERFLVKVACHGPDSIAVNIGDIGVAGHATFRRFAWTRTPLDSDGCELRVKDQELVAAKATVPVQLATKNPDDPWAPSPLVGEAWLYPGVGKLVLGDGKFWLLVDRDWDQECMSSHRSLPGLLLPVGPVECGEVPMPERAKSCDETTPPEHCGDTEKTTGAKSFGAVMLRASHDLPISKIKDWLADHLPGIARPLIDKLTVDAGAAIVLIGTRDADGPKLMRTFVFAGLELFGGSGLQGGVGVAKEAVSTEPLRLATRDPDDYLSPSDLDSNLLHFLPEPAKLKVEGNSNIEELEVGGDLTFAFHDPFCHAADDTTRGWFGAVSPVMCKDITPLLVDVPTRDCNKEKDCPPERQLAGHDQFTFKYGRASIRSLPPVVRKQIEQQAGCEVVAARINIGTEGSDAIYREYVFIGKLADNKDQLPCRFDVEKGSSIEKYTIDRHLDLDEEDSPLVSSDFQGKADLSPGGTVKVIVPAVATPYSFELPGSFDATCTGPQGATGAIVPLDEVKCGAVPDPRHDDTPEALDRCRDLGAQSQLVQDEIAHLRDGDYGEYMKQVHPGEIVYHEALETLGTLAISPGHVVTPAVFVGLTDAGVKVVVLMDIRILSYTTVQGQPWVVIEVLSDPCTFDLHGKPRFVHRVLCAETVAYRGMVAPLRPKSLGKPALPTPDVVPPGSDGTGAGSRAEPAPDEH